MKYTMLAVLLLMTTLLPAQTFNTIYNFAFPDSAGNPLITDSVGNVYGVFCSGGIFNAGSVYELSPVGGGNWDYNTLYSFTGGADGNCPASNLVFDGNNLLGTTTNGGASATGVMFELTPNGSSWSENVLYNFTANLGHPSATSLLDSEGNFYGQIYPATIFELSPSGGVWQLRTICGCGWLGIGMGMTMDGAGNLYSISGLKDLIEISPTGDGTWTSTTLHVFSDPFSYPSSMLALDALGNIYGTTESGGITKSGTVYQLSRNLKTGKWTYKQLYNFTGGADGGFPTSGVTLDGLGNIYGPIRSQLFELSPAARNGTYVEKAFGTFEEYTTVTPLTINSTGELFGGGTYQYEHGGEIFEIVPPAATTTALVSSLNPSVQGQSVMFTATVTSASGTPANGDTVSFMKGTIVLGTGELNDGSATFTTSTLPVGTTTLTAVYGGDSEFNGSVSNKLKQVVKK